MIHDLIFLSSNMIRFEIAVNNIISFFYTVNFPQNQLRFVDIPLRQLVSLPAYGNLQLDGCKVIGFCDDAAPVLRGLFDMTIVKIGDNMRVRGYHMRVGMKDSNIIYRIARKL
jgi:hypothetical protein